MNRSGDYRRKRGGATSSGNLWPTVGTELFAPLRERRARALAAEFDQFRRAMELVERAGVARNRNDQIRRLRGKLEARERGLHGIERVKGGYIGGADPRRDGVVIGD